MPEDEDRDLEESEDQTPGGEDEDADDRKGQPSRLTDEDLQQIADLTTKVARTAVDGRVAKVEKQLSTMAQSITQLTQGLMAQGGRENGQENEADEGYPEDDEEKLAVLLSEGAYDPRGFTRGITRSVERRVGKQLTTLASTIEDRLKGMPNQKALEDLKTEVAKSVRFGIMALFTAGKPDLAGDETMMKSWLGWLDRGKTMAEAYEEARKDRVDHEAAEAFRGAGDDERRSLLDSVREQRARLKKTRSQKKKKEKPTPFDHKSGIEGLVRRMKATAHAAEAAE